MGWNTKKTLQLEQSRLEEEARRKGEENAQRRADLEAEAERKHEQRMQWVRDLTPEEITHIFEPILDVLNNMLDMDSTDEASIAKHDRLVSKVIMMRDAVIETDKERASETQLEKIYKSLHSWIPSAVVQYRGFYISNGEDVFKAIALNVRENYSFTKMLTTLLNIRDELAFAANRKVFFEPTKPVGEVSFPRFKSDSDIINVSLSHLETLWSDAYGRENAIEDEHFLEQIIRIYLPTSWKLYGDFLYASDDIRELAQQTLLEQLDLLTTRVSMILDAHARRSLQELRAHTGFLKEQTDALQNNALSEVLTDAKS